MNRELSPKVIQTQLIFGHFLFALLATTLQPMLPAIQNDLGLSIYESSSIPTLMSITLAVTNLLVGIYISRIGVRTMYIFAGGAGIIASAFGLFSTGYPSLLSGFILYAIAIGSAFTSLVTIYSHLPKENQNYGVFHAAFGIGGILSPLLLNLAIKTPLGFRGVFLLYSILTLANLLFLILTSGIQNTRYIDIDVSKKTSVTGFKNPVIILGVLVLGIYAASEIGTVTFAGNFHIENYSLTLPQSGLLLSLFWILFTLSRLITDPMVKKWGISGVTLFAAIGGNVILGLWILGVGPWIFPGLGFILGPVFPAAQKYVNNHISPEKRGLFNGASYASLGLFTSLTVPVMGAIGETSLSSAFLIPMGLLIVLGILGYILSKKQ